MTQRISLDTSKERLQYLRDLQKKPDLSAGDRKKLPALIQMQERAVRQREKAHSQPK